MTVDKIPVTEIITVDIRKTLLPWPTMPEPSYVTVPNISCANGKIGLFVLVSRTVDMHGIFHLYLGGTPTLDDAANFVRVNPGIFYGLDYVIIGCERMDSIDDAIRHAESITRPNGIVSRENVFFFANYKVAS